MSDIIELLKLAKGAITSLVTQKSAISNKAWDQVVLALDKLSELTTLHVKAINEVTAPVLDTADLLETSRRYSLLVNNPDFPQGYGALRGIVEGARGLSAFQDPHLQQRIRAVLDELYEFQYGAFRLDWDSYHIAAAFAEAARLIQSPQQPSPDEIAQKAAPFLHSYSGLFKEAPNSHVEEPTTTPEFVALVQTWCRAWQQYVQKRLYGGRGLNYAISQLKMQHYEQ
jgi:hypothetical protein